MRLKDTIVILLLSFVFLQCNQPSASNNAVNSVKSDSSKISIPPSSPHHFTYRAMSMKDSGMVILKRKYDTNQLNVIYALNRVDKEHAAHIDTMIIPDTVLTDIMPYSPFPQQLSFLNGVNKIIFFSYPDEAFAAYENGKLVRWGTVNMGRKKDPTPTGLTFVNWKKEVDTSSVKDEWILKWNVNIFNKQGVGFHEYAMPGYPASHSCLRLDDTDAHYLYNWVDEWVAKGEDEVSAYGTPVVILGKYPFDSRKPWLSLPQNPHALDIDAQSLQIILSPDMQHIMTEQQRLAAAKK
jgi:hypothetical protein